MNTNFKTLKNGNNATTVWANPTTKEIYPSHRNSFGYNAIAAAYNSPFYNKYGKDMKTNQGKSNYSQFSYSANAMKAIGFQLIMRNEKILW